jgi:hypothetical protein
MKFARHRKTQDNYRFLRGLICKKLCCTSMVAAGYCFADSWCSRAWKISRSGAKERGDGGKPILYLTLPRGCIVVAEIDGARSDGGSTQLLFLGSGAGHQGTRRVVEEEAGRGRGEARRKNSGWRR